MFSLRKTRGRERKCSVCSLPPPTLPPNLYQILPPKAIFQSRGTAILHPSSLSPPGVAMLRRGAGAEVGWVGCCTQAHSVCPWQASPTASENTQKAGLTRNVVWVSVVDWHLKLAGKNTRPQSFTTSPFTLRSATA